MVRKIKIKKEKNFFMPIRTSREYLSELWFHSLTTLKVEP